MAVHLWTTCASCASKFRFHVSILQGANVANAWSTLTNFKFHVFKLMWIAQNENGLFSKLQLKKNTAQGEQMEQKESKWNKKPNNQHFFHIFALTELQSKQQIRTLITLQTRLSNFRNWFVELVAFCRMAARRQQADGESYGMSTPSGVSPSSPPSLRSMKHLYEGVLAERDQLQQIVADLESKLTDLASSRYEPPEVEELQIHCGTLEAQKRSLEQELACVQSLPTTADASIEDLTSNISKLQDDLSKERHDHSRAQEDLQAATDRSNELEEQMSILQADFDEKLRTFESHKVGWVDNNGWTSEIFECSQFDARNLKAKTLIAICLVCMVKTVCQCFLPMISFENQVSATGFDDTGISVEHTQRMKDLEEENSRLQDDLSKERHDHSRAQADLQAATDRSNELEEQLSILQADFDEKLRTFESHKVGWVDNNGWTSEIFECSQFDARNLKAKTLIAICLVCMVKTVCQCFLPMVSFENQVGATGFDDTGISVEHTQRMKDLEEENSRLQDDLSKERHDHSRAQADLQAATDRSNKLEEQWSILQADFDEKLRTFESHKVGWVDNNGWTSEIFECSQFDARNLKAKTLIAICLVCMVKNSLSMLSSNGFLRKPGGCHRLWRHWNIRGAYTKDERFGRRELEAARRLVQRTTWSFKGPGRLAGTFAGGGCFCLVVARFVLIRQTFTIGNELKALKGELLKLQPGWNKSGTQNRLISLGFIQNWL